MHRVHVVVLTALLAVAGCSSDSSNPPSVAHFTDQLVQAYGAMIARCEPVTADLARQEMLMVLRSEVVAEAQRSGRLALDESKGQECLSWLESASCAELNTQDGPTACLAALVPKVQEGGACTLFIGMGLTAECVSGECVADSPFACTMHGTCKTLAAEGDPCDMPAAFRDCAQGLDCLDNTCQVAQAFVIHDQVGDGCGSYDVCADALYCAGDSTCQLRLAVGADCTGSEQCPIGTSCNGTCQAWKGVGADCVPGDGECIAGAFCDSTTQTCTAFPTVGGTCGSTAEGEYRYCNDSWCEVASPPPPPPPVVMAPAPTGTCRAFLAEGASCEAKTETVMGGGFSWSECGPGKICDLETSTCVAFYCVNF